MPAGATYEPIATTTLGSAQAGITFSSLGSYTDIRLVIVGTASGSGSCSLRFNSDSGTNYSRQFMYGDGSTAGAGRSNSATEFRIGNINTNIAFWTADIFSYGGSTNKTVLSSTSGDQNGSGTVVRSVGLWRSTSAITSIYIFDSSANNLNTGFTATLYGIKNSA